MSEMNTKLRPAAPRKRVTKAQKRRILRRRKVGMAAACLGFVLICVFWQANHPVTSGQLERFGWRQTLSFGELSHLNHLLRKYEITSPASLTMFFATAGAETDNGRLVLEEGGDAYYEKHGYSADERGAGYLQMTHREEQLAFLRAIGDDFAGEDTASYIAETYPWESACWEWSVGKTVPAPNPNAYARREGNRLEIFLATQYAINGWVIDDAALSDIVHGAAYAVEEDGKTVTVGGASFRMPRGWPDRAERYEAAKAIWGE